MLIVSTFGMVVLGGLLQGVSELWWKVMSLSFRLGNFLCTKFGIYRTFWYLAFKIQKKPFFVKIEVCEEIVRFSHIGENTKENLIISGIDFIFVLISLLFITQKAVKAQRFSFVFSPICENRTISSNTSILTKKVFFCILKAKYQNILYIPKFSHQH